MSMNRRAFFGWIKSAPLAFLVLGLGTLQQQDGVSLDGKTVCLGGQKIIELDGNELRMGSLHKSKSTITFFASETDPL